jgi:hypothetical protein
VERPAWEKGKGPADELTFEQTKMLLEEVLNKNEVDPISLVAQQIRKRKDHLYKALVQLLRDNMIRVSESNCIVRQYYDEGTAPVEDPGVARRCEIAECRIAGIEAVLDRLPCKQRSGPRRHDQRAARTIVERVERLVARLYINDQIRDALPGYRFATSTLNPGRRLLTRSTANLTARKFPFLRVSPSATYSHPMLTRGSGIF